jgi:hypothetical protein
VSSTEVIQRAATPALQVELLTASASNPDPSVGEECRKADLDIAVGEGCRSAERLTPRQSSVKEL